MKVLLGILCVFGLFSGPVQAVTISLDPVSQTIDVGGTATVDLNISGLGDLAAPSLGAFFVEITFDDTILDFESEVYGILLGSTDPLDFETDIVTTVGVGSVSLDEISFLFDFELDALQPDSFTLATLTFTGDSVGTSALAFGTVELVDAPESGLLDHSLVTASITVQSPASAPEPGTILLLLSGFGVLVGWRRWSMNGE